MGSDLDSSSDSEGETRRPANAMSDSDSDKEPSSGNVAARIDSSDSSDDENKSPAPRATTPTGMSSGSSSDSDAHVQKQGTTAYSGSDSDDDTQKAQNTALPSSSDDSDDGKKAKPASGVDNMFGDMSSDDSGDEKTKSHMQNLTQDDPMRGSDDEDKRDVTTIPVEIPKINTNLGEQINFVRFPNFLSVEPKPFDAEHYEDEHEEDDDLDEEGRTRLKLKVENTIRWRKVTQPDGTEKIESNAKIVRWSDGSQSLILGNEKYDIQSMKLKGDFNHLFIRQGTGLQGQAVFQTKLTFRPSSTNSLTHKKIMGRLAQRINNPMQKVKVIPVSGNCPHKERERLIREADERGRAELRLTQQRQKLREREMRKNMGAGYLEDDDDNSYSLNAIKRGVHNRSDSESSEDYAERRGPVKKFEDSSDEEDNTARSRNKSGGDSDGSDAPKHKKHVIHDSDDSDDSDAKSTKSNSDKSAMSDSD